MSERGDYSEAHLSARKSQTSLYESIRRREFANVRVSGSVAPRLNSAGLTGPSGQGLFFLCKYSCKRLDLPLLTLQKHQQICTNCGRRQARTAPEWKTAASGHSFLYVWIHANTEFSNICWTERHHTKRGVETLPAVRRGHFHQHRHVHVILIQG